MSLTQVTAQYMTIATRAGPDPGPTIAAIRNKLRALDSDLAHRKNKRATSTSLVSLRLGRTTVGDGADQNVSAFGEFLFVPLLLPETQRMIFSAARRSFATAWTACLSASHKPTSPRIRGSLFRRRN